jgi:hypothetical protein
MPIDQAAVAKPISITEPGHYILEGEIGFVDLMPPREGGSEAARIRLTLGPASILDLPLSQIALAALSHALIPRFPPHGWRKVDE